jgi:hypothetical protein
LYSFDLRQIAKIHLKNVLACNTEQLLKLVHPFLKLI